MPTKTGKLKRRARTAPAKELHDHIADRVCRIADGMIMVSAKSIRKVWNIRHTDLRLLNVLDGEEPLSVNEISRRAIVDQAWVSRSLKMLEQMDLVMRASDPSDSRRSLIKLTKKGHKTLDEVRPYAMKSEKILLKDIDEAKLKQLLDQLELNVEKMLDALEHFTDAAPIK